MANRCSLPRVAQKERQSTDTHGLFDEKLKDKVINKGTIAYSFEKAIKG